MSSKRRRVVISYVVAIASVALAVVLTHLISVAVERTFLRLLLLAVVVSGTYGGIGPGIVAALLGATAGAFWFLGDAGSFVLTANDLISLAIFVVIAIAVGWLSGARRRSEDQLRVARDELEQRVRERTAALRQLNDELRLEVEQRRRAEEEIRAHQQRLRSLALQLSTSEDGERRRLAVALHDAVGHRLAVVAMKLDSALESLPPPRDEEKCLRQARTLVDEIIRCTRSLTTDLSPPILFEVGLRPAIEWLGERFRDEHDLRVRVEGGPDDLDEETRALLFSAARELLMNVVKHSGARHAGVWLGREGEQFVMRVSDDGRGCDAEQLNSAVGTGGFGLFHIRERVTSLGGGVIVTSDGVSSSEGRGCSIRIALPCSGTTVPPVTTMQAAGAP